MSNINLDGGYYKNNSGNVLTDLSPIIRPTQLEGVPSKDYKKRIN